MFTARGTQQHSTEQPGVIARADSERWTRRVATYGWAIAALLIMFAVGRIALTWQVFSQTWDEPGHIACGLQYLLEGRYVYERQHPPGARMATALAPWLAGVTFGPKPAQARDEAGMDALYSGGNYKRNLMLARSGMLPFFALAGVVIWFWTRRAGQLAAVIAVFLFTTTPVVLAHAGLATTDMPATATLTLAFFVLVWWWERPSLWRSVMLGASFALAVYMKYSALAYFSAGACVFLFAEGVRHGLRQKPAGQIRAAAKLSGKLILAGGVFVCLLWAGFRFSRDHILMRAMVRQLLPAYPHISDVRVPMPEFVDGVLQVIDHNRGRHPAWLLGEYSETGWRSFFPLAFAVKTPIPFLLLLMLGLWTLTRAVRGGRADFAALHPMLFAAAIMAVAMSGTINIGVRHILPIYPLLAITSGVGVARLLWESGRKMQLAAAVLCMWQLAASVAAHPDYLPWFNEFVRTDPERVLVDSDLDWGQDLDRLAARVRERGIQELSLSYFGCARPAQHGLPRLRLLGPAEPATGWVAMSLTNKTKQSHAWREFNKGRPAFEWIERFTPVERIGESILLYYIPPGTHFE